MAERHQATTPRGTRINGILAGGSDPRKDSALAAISARIQDATAKAFSLANMASQIADCAFGANPELQGDRVNEKNASAWAVFQVHEEIGRLGRALELIEYNLGRLSAI